MKHEKRERWIGIVFLLLGAAYFIGSFTISSYSGYGTQAVDSKFMPQVLGICMMVLSTIQIAETLKRKGPSSDPAAGQADNAVTAANPEDAKEHFDEEGYIKGADIRSVLIIAAMLALYVAAFKPLGFILSSSLFLLGSISFLTPKEKRNWFWIAGLSVGIPAAVYFLFVSGFKLKLPPGILDF